MKYFGIILSMVSLVSCSNFSPSGEFLSTRKPSDQFVSDATYLENKDNFPTELTGEKADVAVAAKISFPVKVQDLKEEDILVTNGRIKSGSFERVDTKNFSVIVIPVEFGDVSIQVPAGVVTAVVRNKQNAASEKLTINFTDVELDSSLKLQDIPVATQEASEPTKLVMIIDNSASRAGDQGRLAENLRASLESLKDRNVEVFAYSTSLFDSSSIRGENPSAAGRYVGYNHTFTPGVGISRYMAHLKGSYSSYARAVLGSNATFIKNTSAGPVSTPFKRQSPRIFYQHDEIIEEYFLRPSAAPDSFKSSLGGVRFSPADPSNLQQDKLDALKDLIASFGENGSTNELPLCTLAMTLVDAGEHQILGNGDKVAFMIVTDEDQSAIEECPVGYRSKVQDKGFVTVQPGISYLGFYVEYLRTVGGDNGATSQSPYTVGVSSVTRCIVDGENICTPGMVDRKRACTQDEYDRYTKSAKVQGPVLSCSARIVSGAASTKAKWIRNDKTYNIHSTNFDIKEGDSVSTITDKTLVEYLRDQQSAGYMFRDAIQFGRTSSFTQSDAELVKLAGVKEAGGLGKLIKAKADAMFGKSNYIVTAISNKGAANPNKDLCTAKESSESLEINQIADRSISICKNDYGEIFDWFNNFVKNEAQPVYELPDYVADLLSVKLSGSQNALTPANYIFEDGKLTFTNPSILKFGNGEKFTIKYRE